MYDFYLFVIYLFRFINIKLVWVGEGCKSHKVLL